MELDLCLFGPSSLSCSDGVIMMSPSALQLLGHLALTPDRSRRRGTIAEQLYPDSPVPAARRRLSTAIWRLRTEVRAAVGVDPIAATGVPDRVALNPVVSWRVDVAEFERALAPMATRRPTDLGAEDAAALEAAVGLHRGVLLEGSDEDWVLTERHRLEKLYLVGLDQLIIVHSARGDLAALSRFGDLALIAEPLREDTHRRLMAAYAELDRDDLVERQWEWCRQALVDGLGVEPMPETTELHRRLRESRHRAPTPTLSALVTELEHARRDLGRLADVLDRSLDRLHRLDTPGEATADLSSALDSLQPLLGSLPGLRQGLPG